MTSSGQEVTELLNRWASGHQAAGENCGYFFGVAAKAIRHELVDYTRAGGATKRDRLTQVVALDDPPTALTKLHPRHSAGCRTQAFWRMERGGIGRGAQGFAANRDAGLARRQGMALSGTGGGQCRPAPE